MSFCSVFVLGVSLTEVKVEETAGGKHQYSEWSERKQNNSNNKTLIFLLLLLIFCLLLLELGVESMKDVLWFYDPHLEESAF